MAPDRAKVARLRRIERLRIIEHRQTIGEAALAEAALAGAGALAKRTALLAAGYAGRVDAGDGAALARFQRFAAGLEKIHVGARTSADAARDRADTAKHAAAAAEKRVEAVAMLAATSAAALSRREGQQAHAELARKLNWKAHESPRCPAARES